MLRRVPTNPPMMANSWLGFSKRVCSMRTLIIGLFIIDNFFKLLDFFCPPQDGRSHSCSTNPSDVHSLALPFPCAMLHSLHLFFVWKKGFFKLRFFCAHHDLKVCLTYTITTGFRACRPAASPKSPRRIFIYRRDSGWSCSRLQKERRLCIYYISNVLNSRIS